MPKNFQVEVILDSVIQICNVKSELTPLQSMKD